MKRKLTALLLALCMTLTCMAPMASAAGPAQPENADVVIDVSDYGVYPDGSDSAPGIAQVVAQAKKESDAGKSVIIRFPQGTYDIYPDTIKEREFYISNTVGTDSNHKLKKIAILLEDVKNVTVDGEGSTLVSHGKMTPFAAVDSQNVTFKNFTSTFKTPTVVDLTVEQVNGNTAVVYIPESYDYRINGNSIEWRSDVSPYTNQPYWTSRNELQYTQDFDAASGLTWRGGNQLFENLTGLTDLGNHRVQFTYSSRNSNVQPGRCYQMRSTVRDHAGAFLWKSKDVTLLNLDLHFLHGFGIVGQHSENLTLDHVDFAAPLESGRMTAGYADFIQMSGCKGLIDIGHCTFSNPHDDPINVHGTFNQVVERIADNKIKVRYMHNETAGFPNYFVGDEVQFCSKQTLLPLDFTAKVTAVDGPDGMGGTMGEGSGNLTDIILTLDKNIPDAVQANTYVVENITYTPSVKIHDNIFKETPTRGILVTTRKSVIIENNLFDGMGMAGIYISCDNNDWYESGHTEDVTIRNNVFTRGKDKAIYIQPTNRTIDGPIHKNMTIEGNTFYLEKGDQSEVLVDAKCVDGLNIRNNKIYRQDPNVELNISANKTNLAAGENTKLNLTQSGTTFSNRLFHLRGCKNVNISGNLYDGGLNAGTAIYEGTDVSDITISDGAANNESKLLDAVGQVYYVSDNKDVVVVSDAGLVQAVGEGTANVTVYSVCGNRKFQGNTLTFTVGNGEAVNVPTAIQISGADKTSGEEVTFTATVTAPEGADKAVSWKVVDAATGEDTAIATISDAGIVTPVSNGAVEVIARTVNGLTARKLLLIQKDSFVLADGITVDSKQDDHMKIIGEDRVQLETVNGGLYQQQVPGNVVKTALSDDAANATAVIKLEGRPDNGWEDAGLYIYKDADNYVAIQRKYRGDHAAMGVVNEKAQHADETLHDDATDENLYLKLEKNGDSVKASYSSDKTTWIELQTVTNDSLTGPMYVAFAAMHNTSNNRHAFTFTELTVNDNPVALTKAASAPIAEKAAVVYDANTNTATVAPAVSEGAEAIVRWEVASAANGSFNLLDTVGTSLSTTAAMKDQYIRAVVIAKTADGIVGDAVYSDAVQVTGAGAAEGGVMDGTALPELGASNAELKTAEVTGLKTPFAAFDSNSLHYYTTAELTETMMHINFAAADPNAKLEVLFNGEKVAANADLTLHNARNLVEVKVTAEDGVTFQNYRFTVSRTGDSTVNVTGITLNETALADFSEDKTGYAYQLDAGVNTLNVAVEANASKVQISMNGQTANGKTATFNNLKDGESELIIRSTAANGITEKIYRVTIRKPYDTNANLQSVELNGKDITKNLSVEKAAGIYVPTAKNKIHAEAQDPRATVKILRGSEVLAENTGSVDTEITAYDNAKQFTVEIIAVDGQTKTAYTIDLSKGVYLSDLEWESAQDGWKTVQKDHDVNGNQIRLTDENGNAVPFEKGLGTHAESTIVYNVSNSDYPAISGFVGVDHSEYNQRYGSVQFQIMADAKKIYDSDRMDRNDAMKAFDVQIPAGTQKITLKVLKSDNENWNDHADWADIKFTDTFGTTIDVEDEAVKNVKSLIDAIGEVTLESEAKITEARKAYDALTEAQKEKVGDKVNVLTAAEAKLAELKKAEADRKAAAAVDAKIDNLGEITLESNAAVTAARAAYEALTDAQKALVTKMPALEAAEAKLKELQDAADQAEKDQAAANGVIAMIDSIGNVTLESEGKIIDTRAAYDALTAAQKKLVKNQNVLETAEKVLSEIKAKKAVLDAAIKTAEGKKAADYTTESWKAFADALRTAKNTAAKTNVSAVEYENAAKALNTTMDKLTANPVTPEQPSNPTTPAKPDTSSPATGDTLNMTFWAVMAMLSAGAIVIIKKKREQ